MDKKNEQIVSRLDNIEAVLKMLLIDNVLGKNEIERMQEDIIKNAEAVFLPLGMKNPHLYYIEQKYYVFVEVDNACSLKDIKNNYFKSCELLPDLKIVLSFNNINVKRKQALENSKISFFIANGEMKIY